MILPALIPRIVLQILQSDFHDLCLVFLLCSGAMGAWRSPLPWLPDAPSLAAAHYLGQPVLLATILERWAGPAKPQTESRPVQLRLRTNTLAYNPATQPRPLAPPTGRCEWRSHTLHACSLSSSLEQIIINPNKVVFCDEHDSHAIQSII